MANDIDESKVAVIAAIQPEVDNSEHRDLLNNEIIDSLVMRKDRTSAVVEAGASATLDYANMETYQLTISQTIALTLNNLVNGDIRFLKVIKSAGHAVNFSGATNGVENEGYVTAILTTVYYAIYKKYSTVIIKCLNATNLFSSTVDDVYNNISYKYMSTYNFALFTKHKIISIVANSGWTAIYATAQKIFTGQTFADSDKIYNAIAINAKFEHTGTIPAPTTQDICTIDPTKFTNAPPIIFFTTTYEQSIYGIEIVEKSCYLTASTGVITTDVYSGEAIPDGNFFYFNQIFYIPEA